jgi:hypothetical protein
VPIKSSVICLALLALNFECVDKVRSFSEVDLLSETVLIKVTLSDCALARRIRGCPCKYAVCTEYQGQDQTIAN